ncbi:MAG: hypothetical protein AB1489_00930 [Acidobacteriota bacterium]
MANRIKRMLIGFILTIGLQFIFAWIARALTTNKSDEAIVTNADIAFMPLIFTVAVYLGGGLVMGLLMEKFDWRERLEPLAIAIIAVSISVLLNAFLSFMGVGPAPDLFIASILIGLKERAVVPLIINFGSVILAAVIGAFIGTRVKTPTDDWISRGATLLGLVSLVLGPFLLLISSAKDQGRPGLPWYVMTIIVLVFLVVAGIGYILFMREHNEAEEISISPDRRRGI